MMLEAKGWLLDLYEDEKDQVRLWFILEDGRRICLKQDFPLTFYVSGDRELLHACCLMLRNRSGVLNLKRVFKTDVFKSDPVCVLQIDMEDPVRQREAFLQIKRAFPRLICYNADLAIHIHYAARYGTFPMAFCALSYDAESLRIADLSVLNSRWDITPVHPVFRLMEIAPDCNPDKGTPQNLLILDGHRRSQVVRLNDPTALLETLNRLIADFDPDMILSQWGDSWLFPFLAEKEAETGIRLRVNRDSERDVLWKKDFTYFSYGHVIYRGREAHLFGRCHIDTCTAIMWRDYGLSGTLESARVTTMPIERAARVSPGSGISAMQMITALQKEVLVPEQKQQVETFKNGTELIQHDRGGLVYQPRVGLHCNVAQIDFVSMYPAVIINGNISPEVPLPDGLTPASDEPGIVPLTLKPLYQKRVEIKHCLMKCKDKKGAIAKNFASRASALKWLLVVCFGFLGYKNARFGRIEAHEAVTFGGREALLRAKEVCEEQGFELLHMFVDALWIYKPGYTTITDYDSVLQEISRRTGMVISLDGIYRWIVFLPSRANDNYPVPNRYFGVFQDGSLKIRGIESHRHDLPPWVVNVQLKMLDCLAKTSSRQHFPETLQAAFAVFKTELQKLDDGEVPLEELVLTNRISRELDDYKTPTAAVRAACQLLDQTGRKMGAGQKVSFIYTKEDVFAWDQPAKVTVDHIDKVKYRELLARAAGTIFYPFGIKQQHLSDFVQGRLQLSFDMLPYAALL